MLSILDWQKLLKSQRISTFPIQTRQKNRAFQLTVGNNAELLD